MLGTHTLRNASYAAIVMMVLTLTGIFNSFAGRDVLGDDLSLSTLVLLGALIGTGYLVAAPLKYRDLTTTIVNGVVGALILAAGVALIIVFSEAVDSRFVFANMGKLLGGPVTFGQDNLSTGLLLLFVVGAICGAFAGLLVHLPDRVRDVLFISTALTLVLGILQNQINNVIALSDALALLAVFAAAYFIALRFAPEALSVRLAIGAAVGLVGGIILLVIASSGLNIGGKAPIILGLPANGNTLFMMLVFVVVGVVGAIMPRASHTMHTGAWSFLAGILVLSLLSWQRQMNLLTAVLTFGIIALAQWLLPPVSEQTEQRYEKLPQQEQKTTRRLVGAALLGVLLFIPPFAGLSLTNTMNLTALNITMGIGLSVMIGYAGLLDLGYVASYAIGAYTIGLLTTPSLLTCGGMTPDQISASGQTIAEACTGVMTFWQGAPVAVLASAITGMLLGVPVLRLRGDYLAIVTLGFGEIIQVLIKSNTFKPLLGGAQGIISIPLPQLNLTFLNPAWDVRLAKSTEVYYLYIFGVIVAAFIVLRLVNTRLGRAWRAMREDEDVAEAMGINLTATKLLAFGISSAFAGLGGAIFGTSFQSIFPNSFTLMVSINVLSLIIIGGMGSIPGVILGALILIGLPEMLRELQDYRFLAFGALLVTVMVLKPDGLLPPQPPKLSEQATPQPQGAD